MKNFIKLPLLLLFVFLLPTVTNAQQERNKIVMTVNHGGKNITADLGTVSYGITRYADYGAIADATTATDKKDKTDKIIRDKTTPERGSYYLSLTVKSVSGDLLKLMAKKDTRFNGTITVTDTYGKNPPREIKFTNASLESYSDQYTAFTYDDNYAIATMSLSCSSFTLNGVVME